MGGLGSGLKAQNWDPSTLTKFEKSFYIESPAVSARSEREVSEYKKTHAIQTFGRDIPKPVTGFLEVGFPGERAFFRVYPISNNTDIML